MKKILSPYFSALNSCLVKTFSVIIRENSESSKISRFSQEAMLDISKARDTFTVRDRSKARDRSMSVTGRRSKTGPTSGSGPTSGIYLRPWTGSGQGQ